MTVQIALSDVLDHISNELLQADSRARQRGKATMQFAECELEFAVNLEKSGKAGIKVWVLNLGGGVKKTESNIIRIKFSSIKDNVLQAPHLVVAEQAGPQLARQKQPGRRVRRDKR
jgi:hypothetical protein